MVFFKGPNLVGPENRDERGAYEEMEDRIRKYMSMEDDEWDALYNKMYYDRKYPGQNNLKLMVIPCFLYTGLASAFSFELFKKRASFGKSPYNFVKLAMVPVLTVLTFRNIDVGLDIVRYRRKYPEMYQP